MHAGIKVNQLQCNSERSPWDFFWLQIEIHKDNYCSIQTPLLLKTNNLTVIIWEFFPS